MAVLQMRKLCICGLKKERKPILELLQNSGVVQINKGDGPEEFFEKIDTQVARSGFERNAAIAETALEILDEYAPESKGMFAALEGKREINNEEASRIVRNRERTIQYANKIIGLKKDVDKIEADIVKLEAKLEAITPWLNMDVAGLTKGTMRTSY